MLFGFAGTEKSYPVSDASLPQRLVGSSYPDGGIHA